MRIAFYCGVVSFASFSLNYFSWLMIGYSVIVDGGERVLPFLFLFMIPAVQAGSWRIAGRAFGLACVAAYLQNYFTSDFLIPKPGTPILVPGGDHWIYPTGSKWFLVLELALFCAFLGLPMAWFYDGTKIAGIGYLTRFVIGSFALTVSLYLQLKFADFYYGYDGESIRAYWTCWAIGSVVWLLECGVFATLLFGVTSRKRV